MENTAVEIRKQTEEEIRTQITKTQGKWLSEQLSSRPGQVKDTNRRRKLRRELARLQTVLTEKEFLNRPNQTEKEVIKK